jgi:thioredoxin reductase (NADPH)
MRFIVGQPTGIEQADGRLTGLQVTTPDNEVLSVPLERLMVFFGLSPKLGPIGDWGLGIDRKQLTVDTEKFETTEPGIFAVGDVNTYPGKKKLILSGFHEAALAAFGAAAYVFPDKRIHLEYTTTSVKLHKVLGVETPTFD